MKIVVTSNITKVAARYRRMARNLPGIVAQAMHDLVQDEAVPLYQNTTATWQHQPTFTPQQTERGWAVKANPVNPYGWVDKGTPRHPITARNAPYLVWNYPFTAKSKPNVISAFAGGVGRNVASKKQVYNQIRARNFTDIIMRRMQSRAANKTREALNQASYGAGQGL